MTEQTEATLRALTDERHDLGEGVLWDTELAVLWWTDIHASRLHQHDPASGAHHSWPLPQRLGSFALTAQPGVLLLGLERQLARFDSRSEALELLAEVESQLPTTRINDGRCDRHGNFVFGSMNEDASIQPIGSFYRYTASGHLQRMELPKVAIANSIAFSPDGATMYFCDSPQRRIMACDYDGLSGATSRLRVFAELASDGAAVPDGSTVDADGYLWNAQWGGGRVVRYAPDGRIDHIVPVTPRQPSCVSFAGPTLDQLCITSARRGLDGANAFDGAVLYGSAPRSRGLPEARYGGFA
ncbi:MAG: SMP-30/gluconolactonase/LRE family protein [Dyella sp.]